jgi:predicted enzyme related to lactoylglutathione lyase
MSKKMSADTNIINWFEIPVTDMARARKFYEAVFDITLTETGTGGTKMAMFPYEGGSGKAGGALIQSHSRKPSQDGVVVYLNANPDLNTAAGRIESEGGKISMGKTLIDENSGYMAFFTDTEGNLLGLHSNG